MTQRPGDHPEELLSASLTGELTPVERSTMDAHLASCPECRATLAAFREQRRLVSGLRHVEPPYDLAARVRAATERPVLPLWRRPSTLVAGFASLATVAAALLAVLVFTSNLPDDGIGATGSPSSSGLASLEPTASAVATTEPSQSAAATPLPSNEVDPNPVGTLSYTLEQERPRLEVTTDQTREISIGQHGLPIDVALSPDGAWIAFRVKGEGSDLVDTYAYRIADETLVGLAQRNMDSPFARLAWSPDSSMLAYTAIADDGSADAWLFEARAAQPATRRLTDHGAAFAADFYGAGAETAFLWISAAGEEPTTYGVEVPGDGAVIDLPADARETHANAFLPMRNIAGALDAAVWHGQMAQTAGAWRFSRGGMLHIAEPGAEGGYDLSAAGQQVFPTLEVVTSGQGFAGARFAWAPDGDGFAVWDAEWTGTQQPEGFPDETRVYFGHVNTDTFIGPMQALDKEDTAGGDVVHVALGGGQYLALTVSTAAGSEAGEYGPTAELRLVTRNLGDVPDDVQVFGMDRVWTGPAFYPTEIDTQP